MCVTSGVAAGISIATTMLSAAGSAYSQGQSRKQAKALSRYNSEMSLRDAELAEIKSADVLAQGQKDQEEARREYKARVGSMAAKFGASNVSMDSGSALALLADTTQLGELDALDIRAKAERQSQDYLRAAADAKNKAGLLTQQGNLDASNSLIGMGDSIIDDVGSIGNDAADLFSMKNTSNNNKKRGPSYF